MRQYDFEQGKRKAKVAFFDSVSEAGRYCLDGTEAFQYTGGDGKFYGGMSTRAAVERSATGATEAELKVVEALLDKVDADAHGREADAWLPSPVGAYPCVPDVLMGLPDNMRQRLKVEDDRSPVRLFIEIGVSCGVSESVMIKRGAALAALAMRMREMRPVELYVVGGFVAGPDDSTTALGAIRLSTTPLAPAEIAFTCANPLFVRNMMFTTVRKVSGATSKNSSLPFPWYESTSCPKRNQAMRDALGLQPQDIYLPGGMLHENELFATDPVAWVHSYLDAQRDVE